MRTRFRPRASIAGFALAIAACSPDRTVAPRELRLTPNGPSADIADIATDPIRYSQTSSLNTANAVVGPGTTFVGDEFVVPAGQVWTVQSVIVSGQLVDPALPLSIRVDASGHPGIIIDRATMTPNATDGQTCCSAVVDYLFTLPFRLTLSAGTYWLVLESSTAGEPTFRFQPTAAAQGSVVLVSENGGSVWEGLSAQGIAFSVFGTSRLTQSIAFDPATPTAATTGTNTTFIAAATSGLPVSLTAGPANVCTLSGTTLSFLAVGTCTVTANQAGDTQYAPAQAKHDIEVEEAPIQLPQTITFSAITPNPSVVGSTQPLSAIGGGSGLAVVFATTTPNVCTVTANAVFFVGVGTCVIAANQPGNSMYTPALEVTQTVEVDYRFSGFSSPVSSTGINSVKAGRTIPLKWRVTDAAGVPITTLTSATITVADLSCSADSTSNQVEESTSGGSGLQYLGDGYYQLNWKLPGSYAKSCKTLQLDLGEGSGVRTASFAFTK